jgi:hypothetical protein
MTEWIRRNWGFVGAAFFIGVWLVLVGTALFGAVTHFTPSNIRWDRIGLAIGVIIAIWVAYDWGRNA